MAESDSDHIVASLAVGFTLGFGLLTVWEAIKQTRRSKNPRRSAYIYMIWYVDINRIWDRISKALICLVDAGLNYYFLRIVKQRLLNQYGLMKYAPLVTFNARLMTISVLLDVLLIGLMSLPNQAVFMLFHPLVYTAKLNIEMTMASLIVKLARSGRADAHEPGTTSHDAHHSGPKSVAHDPNEREVALKTFTESKIRASYSGNSDETGEPVPNGGIQRTREFQVTVHRTSNSLDEGKETNSPHDDEAWLTRYPGHPRGTAQDGRSTTSTNTVDS
ncbi:hypothetical protein SLS53_009102 [Cytospora paraplurivora]|uniref:Uncharacterized protein n=1 Tax=Cytospora paraplurivora TaxID=2898453 RepID=A0AAN9TWB1_9PEZI